MTTAEAFALSQQNTREYECDLGTIKYGKFNFNDSSLKMTNVEGLNKFCSLLLNVNTWKLKTNPVKDMTKDDIEKALGYKINIVNNKEDSTKTNKNEYLNFYDFLSKVFDELEDNKNE